MERAKTPRHGIVFSRAMWGAGSVVLIVISYFGFLLGASNGTVYNYGAMNAQADEEWEAQTHVYDFTASTAEGTLESSVTDLYAVTVVADGVDFSVKSGDTHGAVLSVEDGAGMWRMQRDGTSLIISAPGVTDTSSYLDTADPYMQPNSGGRIIQSDTLREPGSSATEQVTAPTEMDVTVTGDGAQAQGGMSQEESATPESIAPQGDGVAPEDGAVLEQEPAPQEGVTPEDSTDRLPRVTLTLPEGGASLWMTLDVYGGNVSVDGYFTMVDASVGGGHLDLANAVDELMLTVTEGTVSMDMSVLSDATFAVYGNGEVTGEFRDSAPNWTDINVQGGQLDLAFPPIAPYNVQIERRYGQIINQLETSLGDNSPYVIGGSVTGGTLTLRESIRVIE